MVATMTERTVGDIVTVAAALLRHHSELSAARFIIPIAPLLALPGRLLFALASRDMHVILIETTMAWVASEVN